MEMTLKRVDTGATFTLGDLYVDGNLFCNSIEDIERVLNSKEDKVPGETAIPKGRYRVVLTYSNKFKRMLPLLKDVPFFTGIRMHRGYTEKDSAGCIVVGERRKAHDGHVYNSTKTESKLVDILRGLPKDEECWITIE